MNMRLISKAHRSNQANCPAGESNAAMTSRGVFALSKLRLHRLVILALLATSGCGASHGQLLYFMGVGRRAKVEAEFYLTDQPVLVLVDDVAGKVDWPMATRYLTDDVSQELIRHNAANKIIPRQTLENLHRNDHEFDKRSARELGELVGAEQVIWIEVREFLANEEFHSVTNAAYFAVTVKVLNVLEHQSRSRVRLWPAGPAGHAVSVGLTGADVSMARTKDAISKELSKDLSIDIARLFYDWRPEDLERIE